MKTIFVLLFCFVGFLALIEITKAEDTESWEKSGHQLCDGWECGMDCYEQGKHGQCDPDDVCRCYNCIYTACRRNCLRRNAIGQCNESECLCL